MKVATLAEVPPGTVIEVEVAGKSFAVCNAGGTLYALDGVCLHRGGPLGQGELDGYSLVCPWHAWEWDCRTGECVHNAAYKVARYEVKTEAGDVLLMVP